MTSNSDDTQKPKGNIHVRNLNIGLIAVLGIAIFAAAVPYTGPFVSVAIIVVAGIPMMIIRAIVGYVVSSRASNQEIIESLSAAEQLATGAPSSDRTETGQAVSRETLNVEIGEQKKLAYFHLFAGLLILSIAVANIVISQQTHSSWQQMIEVPFWWIIALSTTVSFLFSAKRFKRIESLRALAPVDKPDAG